jgi:hypothetical protein
MIENKNSTSLFEDEEKRKIAILERIEQLFEENEGFTDLSAYIDSKIPGLTDLEKAQFIYQALVIRWRKADTKAYESFFRNVSAESIKRGLDFQIRLLEKHASIRAQENHRSSGHSTITDVARHLLAHGVVHTTTYQKK